MQSFPLCRAYVFISSIATTYLLKPVKQERLESALNKLHISIDTPVPEQIFVSKNKASEFKAWVVSNNDTE